MKAIFILLCFISISSINAQEITGKIKYHKKSEMDLVLMPFGADNWLTIGKVNKNGVFTADLSSAKMDEEPEALKSKSMSVLYFSFFFSCSDKGSFGVHTEKAAIKQDYVRLTKNGQWAGTSFLVSEEALIPWLEDPGYNNPITGSFCEVLYVDEDISLDFTCENTIQIADNEKIETSYEFKIDLKRGFNWVQYTIKEIYETDPNIRASIPSKIMISNVQDFSKIMWVGKYY